MAALPWPCPVLQEAVKGSQGAGKVDESLDRTNAPGTAAVLLGCVMRLVPLLALPGCMMGSWYCWACAHPCCFPTPCAGWAKHACVHIFKGVHRHAQKGFNGARLLGGWLGVYCESGLLKAGGAWRLSNARSG
jgi:hypothetical protein